MGQLLKNSYFYNKVASIKNKERPVITAGIKDTKNNLSRYLAQVKDGEEVLITDHGKVVARIIKEGERANRFERLWNH